MMRDNWGASEVDWHDAKDWATNAANHGLNVISIPAVGTIGVSTTLSSTGHVAYVTAVNNDSSVYVSEMDCGSTGVFYNKYYAAGTFNAGFIYPNYYNGTPGINSLTSGTPTHSGIAQNITFSISNGFLAIEEVHITFPSGGHAILSGSAITSISGTSMTINAVLSTAGTWHIEAINNNGTISNNYAFTVI
jgi:surface antigen